MQSSDPEASLTVKLFGTFKVEIAGQPMRKLRSRSGEWLLAFLVLNAGRTVERQAVAASLWPESPETMALQNLRRTLTDIRPALGAEAARLTSPSQDSLHLDMAGAWVDVIAFDAALKRGTADDIELALTVYRGPFLKDCSDDWAFFERGFRHQQIVRFLEQRADLAREAGNIALELKCLRRALEGEPHHEGLTRNLMTALAACKDYDEPERLFNNLRVWLAQQGEKPEIETSALAKQIRDQGRKARQPQRPRPPGPVGNVPIPPSQLMGREREPWQILALLDNERLVTLTGPGGVGKTLLALTAANNAWPDYPDGVWFIDLSAMRLPDEIAAVITTTVGSRKTGGVPGEALLSGLQAKQLLLVLDNCEHLLPECSKLASRILQRCGDVRILATSRHALGLREEWIIPVPPLLFPPDPFPPLAFGPPSEGALTRLLEHSAIALFVERASQVRHGFALTPENAAAVVQVCGRLDGIPLALELAAARTRSLSILEIARRLQDRFDLLAGGDPTVDPRHQTMEAALVWSYDLLPKDEQRLWHELSTFSGGFTLDAAESVCTLHPHERPIISRLIGLVAASVVSYSEEEGAARYLLHETLRQYGREKLYETPDHANRIRRRHRNCFVQWAEAVQPHLFGPDQALWLKRVEKERANIHRALEYSEEEEEGAEGLRLSGALWRFWYIRGYYEEGYRWLTRMLEIGAEEEVSLRVTALTGAGNLAYRQSRLAVAKTHFEATLALERSRNRVQGIARALGSLANIANAQQEYSEARALFEESLEIFRSLNDLQGIASTLGNLATLACHERNFAEAIASHEESIALFRGCGDWQYVAMGLANLAGIQLTLGELTAVWPLLQESLEISGRLSSKHTLAHCLHLAICLAAEQGHYRTAAVIEGADEALRHSIDLLLPEEARSIQEHACGTVRDRLKPEDYQQLLIQGREMTTEELVAFVLATFQSGESGDLSSG